MMKEESKINSCELKKALTNTCMWVTIVIVRDYVMMRLVGGGIGRHKSLMKFKDEKSEVVMWMEIPNFFLSTFYDFLRKCDN